MNVMFDCNLLADIKKTLIPALPETNIFTEEPIKWEGIKINFSIEEEGKLEYHAKQLEMASFKVNFKEYNRKEDGEFLQFTKFAEEAWVVPMMFTHVFICEAKLRFKQ